MPDLPGGKLSDIMYTYFILIYRESFDIHVTYCFVTFYMREKLDLLYLVISIFFLYENQMHRAAEVCAADCHVLQTYFNQLKLAGLETINYQHELIYLLCWGKR